MIQQSPDKANILYTKQYLDKNDLIEKQFGSIIDEVKMFGIDTPRTIIYCQTRKQCSVLFRRFEVFLCERLFHGIALDCKHRVVDMFHAGTPNSVKEHIAEQMASDTGVIRILIATIAFGMGVNCKQVRRIVHFGPSKSIESYVQECGRAGRDEKQSTCILLYNGLLSVQCDSGMRAYLNHEGCLRDYLMIHFGYKVDHSKFQFMHSCCGNCLKSCMCGTSVCKKLWTPQLGQDSDVPELYGSITYKPSKMMRVVTNKDKKLLKERLIQWQRELVHKYKIENMVTCPNVLLEINMYHIHQVLDSCCSLFTLNDVLNAVEIWRNKYAIDILKIIKEVFGEKDIEIPDEIEESDEEDVIIPAWDILRNDSTLLELLDSQDLVDFESTLDTDDSHDISYR